jgi:tight adherence protein C
VRSLAILLAQAERLGTDVTSALLEFSANFRTTLRQRAQAQANRASFWMVFPSIFCLWIPAAVILVAPIVFEFRRQRDDARKIMDEVRRNRDNARIDAVNALRDARRPR